MPVAYSAYHMQRREDFYGAYALTFRPERWEDAELVDVKWGYLPFNGGPRLCLGSESHHRPPSGKAKANFGPPEDFGLMLASYGITRIIQSFPNLRIAPGETLEEPGTELQNFTLTLSNAEGCKVLLD
jgi:Cytochrome P450